MTTPFAVGPTLSFDLPEEEDALDAPLAEQPEAEDAEDAAEAAEERRRALVGLFGTEPPFASDDVTPQDYVAFARSLWERHAMQSAFRVHRAQYLRRFRTGEQWLSSKNNGPWREPPRPKGVVRKVVNVVGPALDWRHQVVAENKPGARVNPATLDQDDMMRAEAAQRAIEFQYHQQNLAAAIREAEYEAQTAGVSFIESWWDPDRGPLDPESGAPLGDVSVCVHRIENVRVSANATATEAPRYWIVRRILPKSEAIARYGDDVAGEGDGGMAGNTGLQSFYSSTNRWDSNGMALMRDDDMLVEQDTVDELTVYIARLPVYLPDGLVFRVVGNKLVYGPADLKTKHPPIVRVTDGSPDPAFFCRPVCEDWIEDQMCLNAVVSKWVENVRRNAGGKFLAKAQSIVSDTLYGDQDTIIEVRSPGPLGDVVQPLQGFSIGRDATGLFEMTLRRLETLTGWNDAARGQFASDASGRAILAVREQLERVFAPMVISMADAIRQHYEITLDWMRWGYTVPRAIGVTGSARPDLARLLVGDDLTGELNVVLDPETMMPTPRSLKLHMLDDWFSRGLISAEEYRERYNFAIVSDVRTPKRLQEQAAMRAVDALLSGEPVPDIEWVHDAAVFQDVIERRVLLETSSRVTPQQRQLARELWQQYAQLSMEQQGLAPPSDPSAAPAGGGDPLGLPPQQAPTLALPSGLAVDPLLRQQVTAGQAARASGMAA